MNNSDILHLAALARLRISENEAADLTHDVAAIVAYVSTIDTLVANEVSEKRVGDRYNVLREDVVAPPASASPAELIAQAPQTRAGYVVVKKVLG